MRLYTDKDKEKVVRETLLVTADEYRNLRESIGIPIPNSEKFMDTVEEASINLYLAEDEREKRAGKVKIDKKQIDLQTDYLESLSDLERKDILFHELSDLSSPLFDYYEKNLHEIVSKYNEMIYEVGNDTISATDVYMGLTAIEGVTAEWLAERAVEELSGNSKERKIHKVSVLNNEIDCVSDFNLDSVYVALQGYVEDFARAKGYENFHDFIKDIYSGKVDFDNLVTNDNIEYVGNLGRLAKGVYKENNFWKNSNVSEKDIAEALDYLNKGKEKSKVESEDAKKPEEDRADLKTDIAEESLDIKDEDKKGKVTSTDIVEADIDRKISYSLIGSIKSFFSRILDRFKGEGEK